MDVEAESLELQELLSQVRAVTAAEDAAVQGLDTTQATTMVSGNASPAFTTAAPFAQRVQPHCLTTGLGGKVEGTANTDDTITCGESNCSSRSKQVWSLHAEKAPYSNTPNSAAVVGVQSISPSTVLIGKAGEIKPSPLLQRPTSFTPTQSAYLLSQQQEQQVREAEGKTDMQSLWYSHMTGGGASSNNNNNMGGFAMGLIDPAELVRANQYETLNRTSCINDKKGEEEGDSDGLNGAGSTHTTPATGLYPASTIFTTTTNVGDRVQSNTQSPPLRQNQQKDSEGLFAATAKWLEAEPNAVAEGNTATGQLFTQSREPVAGWPVLFGHDTASYTTPTEGLMKNSTSAAGNTNQNRIHTETEHDNNNGERNTIATGERTVGHAVRVASPSRQGLYTLSQSVHVPPSQRCASGSQSASPLTHVAMASQGVQNNENGNSRTNQAVCGSESGSPLPPTSLAVLSAMREDKSQEGASVRSQNGSNIVKYGESQQRRAAIDNEEDVMDCRRAIPFSVSPSDLTNPQAESTQMTATTTTNTFGGGLQSGNIKQESVVHTIQSRTSPAAFTVTAGSPTPTPTPNEALLVNNNTSSTMTGGAMYYGEGMTPPTTRKTFFGAFQDLIGQRAVRLSGPGVQSESNCAHQGFYPPGTNMNSNTAVPSMTQGTSGSNRGLVDVTQGTAGDVFTSTGMYYTTNQPSLTAFPHSVTPTEQVYSIHGTGATRQTVSPLPLTTTTTAGPVLSTPSNQLMAEFNSAQGRMTYGEYMRSASRATTMSAPRPSTATAAMMRSDITTTNSNTQAYAFHHPSMTAPQMRSYTAFSADARSSSRYSAREGNPELAAWQNSSSVRATEPTINIFALPSPLRPTAAVAKENANAMDMQQLLLMQQQQQQYMSQAQESGLTTTTAAAMIMMMAEGNSGQGEAFDRIPSAAAEQSVWAQRTQHVPSDLTLSQQQQILLQRMQQQTEEEEAEADEVQQAQYESMMMMNESEAQMRSWAQMMKMAHAASTQSQGESGVADQATAMNAEDLNANAMMMRMMAMMSGSTGLENIQSNTNITNTAGGSRMNMPEAYAGAGSMSAGVLLPSIAKLTGAEEEQQQQEGDAAGQLPTQSLRMSTHSNTNNSNMAGFIHDAFSPEVAAYNAEWGRSSLSARHQANNNNNYYYNNNSGTSPLTYTGHTPANMNTMTINSSSAYELRPSARPATTTMVQASHKPLIPPITRGSATNTRNSTTNAFQGNAPRGTTPYFSTNTLTRSAPRPSRTSHTTAISTTSTGSNMGASYTPSGREAAIRGQPFTSVANSGAHANTLTSNNNNMVLRPTLALTPTQAARSQHSSFTAIHTDPSGPLPRPHSLNEHHTSLYAAPSSHHNNALPTQLANPTLTSHTTPVQSARWTNMSSTANTMPHARRASSTTTTTGAGCGGNAFMSAMPQTMSATRQPVNIFNNTTTIGALTPSIIPVLRMLRGGQDSTQDGSSLTHPLQRLQQQQQGTPGAMQRTRSPLTDHVSPSLARHNNTNTNSTNETTSTNEANLSLAQRAAITQRVLDMSRDQQGCRLLQAVLDYETDAARDEEPYVPFPSKNMSSARQEKSIAESHTERHEATTSNKTSASHTQGEPELSDEEEDAVARRFGQSVPIQRIIAAILPTIAQVMSDAYGNFLVQKLLEVAPRAERRRLLAHPALSDHLCSVAASPHGTFAVQRLIETLRDEVEEEIVFGALQRHLLQLFTDVNGGHVLVKLMVYVRQRYMPTATSAQRSPAGRSNTSNSNNSSSTVGGPLRQQQQQQQARLAQVCAKTRFLYEGLQKDLLFICQHRQGCCIMQKCLNFFSEIFPVPEENVKSTSLAGATVKAVEGQENYFVCLVRSLLKYVPVLAVDPYGNYVITHIVELCYARGHMALLDAMAACIEEHLVTLCKNKFASNVVEHVVGYCSEERIRSVCRLLMTPQSSETSATSTLVTQQGPRSTTPTTRTIVANGEEDEDVEEENANNGNAGRPRGRGRYIPLIDVAMDGYGNYVVQTLLTVAPVDELLPLPLHQSNNTNSNTFALRTTELESGNVGHEKQPRKSTGTASDNNDNVDDAAAALPRPKVRERQTGIGMLELLQAHMPLLLDKNFGKKLETKLRLAQLRVAQQLQQAQQQQQHQ